MRVLHKSLLAAALLAAPLLANAESTFASGNGTLSASARLDFRITVPRVLYLSVGQSSPAANNATVDLIDFDVPAAQVGNGNPVAATAGSGDLNNGSVSARLIGNGGPITLVSQANNGALSNGNGASISFSAITTTVASLTSSTPLPHPTLTDTGTSSVTLTPTAGNVIVRDARWTYSYSNTAVVPAGTYGGANAGRVTYTASMP